MTGIAPARSAVEHFTELLISEVDEAGVDVAVVVGRAVEARSSRSRGVGGETPPLHMTA